MVTYFCVIYSDRIVYDVNCIGEDTRVPQHLNWIVFNKVFQSRSSLDYTDLVLKVFIKVNNSSQGNIFIINEVV